ncbi:hypothetical protein EAE92_11310 [Photorhabdus hainanensis]|nr:hypothetical protein [Photorhabdus hainanensis]
MEKCYQDDIYQYNFSASSVYPHTYLIHYILNHIIPVIFQAASLLAAFTHPGHIVLYATGDSLPCRRDAT